MEIKLAEALLRRKELAEKVNQLRAIDSAKLYEVRVQRKKVSDDIDDIVASVPKLQAAQVTAEYDFYARQMRLIDAAIQQANWTTSITAPDTVLNDYKADKPAA